VPKPKPKRARPANCERKPLTVDPDSRHPSNLSKQLTNHCNAHGIDGAPRAVLRGLLDFADPLGWSYPGHAQLGVCYSSRPSGEEMARRGLRELEKRGVVGVIDRQSDAASRYALRGVGAPKNTPHNKRTNLYLLLPIATAEALAFFHRMAQDLGQAPPARASECWWSIEGHGPRKPLFLASDVLARIQRGELEPATRVKTAGMRSAVPLSAVPEFAAAFAPKQWFLSPQAAATMKPLDHEHVVTCIYAGGIKPDTRIYAAGTNAPVCASDVPEFAEAFQAALKVGT